MCKETKLISIEKNVELNDYAFARISKSLHVGMTEQDVYRILTQLYAEKAGKAVTFAGDIVSGERTADIEGPATERVLQMGDTLILDIQPALDGWVADTTRTFFVGSPTEKMVQAYHLIESALKAGESCLRPGVRACEIYKSVADALKNDLGLSFPHHAGHTVGRVSVVEPRLIPEEDQPINEGMIIALEPGLYGEFGIRVENNYEITKNGFRKLGSLTTDIERFII